MNRIKIILSFLIMFFLISCTTIKKVAIFDSEGKEIYSTEGKLKAEPNFESSTFNIKIKEETGEEIVFFGSLSGYVLDTKTY